VTNNDVLRSIRYTYDFSDPVMISIFALADYDVNKQQVKAWLKKEDDEEWEKMSDTHLAIFLNGLISHLRGKKDGPQPEPEKCLSNNIIFRKLKIALNLKDVDVIEMMSHTSMKISKPELSAFFRRRDHKNYRECKDQVLRYFLKSIHIKYHSDTKAGRATKVVEPVETKPEPQSKKKPETKKKAVNQNIWGKL
jgi:uncharacterized protein YehS (DUF1456 family)